MYDLAKRKVDDLGRIVLPVEVRREMGIGLKDELAIYVKDGNIVLKKAHSSCIMCQTIYNLTIINNNYLCSDCILKIKETV